MKPERWSLFKFVVLLLVVFTLYAVMHAQGGTLMK
jgi:hypothetical protein